MLHGEVTPLSSPRPCANKKIYTFYIKHHQNGSRFYHFVLSWVYVHVIYYIEKNGNQIWWFKI